MKLFSGFGISYYKTEEDYEVDFLVQNSRGQKKLFQVAWDIDDPKTMEREMRALESAKRELKIEGDLITLNSYLELNIKVFQV